MYFTFFVHGCVYIGPFYTHTLLPFITFQPNFGNGISGNWELSRLAKEWPKKSKKKNVHFVFIQQVRSITIVKE